MKAGLSYAPPNSTRAEIERLAPTARRTLGYFPAWAAPWLSPPEADPRAVPTSFSGWAWLPAITRNISDHTILTIPEGIDPARIAASGVFTNQRVDRSRGGLLFGFEVPDHGSCGSAVSPDVRYVYGGTRPASARSIGEIVG